MSESLTKQSQLEIATTLLNVSKQLAIFLETNFNSLSDGEFTTLHILQARLTSEAGDIARQAVTMPQTGINDLQQKLVDATTKARSAINTIKNSRKMILFIAAVLDFAVDVSVGIASGNWNEAVDSGRKLADLAGAAQPVTSSGGTGSL